MSDKPIPYSLNGDEFEHLKTIVSALNQADKRVSYELVTLFSGELAIFPKFKCEDKPHEI